MHLGWLHDLSRVLAKYAFCNAIAVDWKSLAGCDYVTSSQINVEKVGKVIAKLILFLFDVGFRIENMHVIGHSLGAHVAGYCGKSLNGLLGKITGMIVKNKKSYLKNELTQNLVN